LLLAGKAPDQAGNAIFIRQPVRKLKRILIADDKSEQRLKEYGELAGRESNGPMQFEENRGGRSKTPPRKALRDKFRHWLSRGFAATHSGRSIACLYC